MTQHSTTSQSLHTRDGRRKYLNAGERDRFIAAAWNTDRMELGALCLVLAYSGCRISEALALTPAAFDSDARTVTLRSLKKRGGSVVFRQVPLPARVIAIALQVADRALTERIWPWSRGRAWELVKAMMRTAGIATGPHMTPKGLRHAFGVHAICYSIPLHLLQRWLGHARLTTTAIYADVVGPEERLLAERMWLLPQDSDQGSSPPCA